MRTFLRSLVAAGAVALTVVATAALAFTRVNPVWILLAAGVAGVAGLA